MVCSKRRRCVFVLKSLVLQIFYIKEAYLVILILQREIMASILPCIVILFMITTAQGLKCYSCNSKDSVSCKWGLTSFTYNTEECTSAGLLDSIISPKCFKITAQNKEGAEYIGRGCLPPGTVGCSQMATVVGWLSSASSDSSEALSNLSCETCETDKCNSATKLTGFAFIGLILSAIAFLL